MGSSPGPIMWKLINSCRNVSAMLWNPAKRHDECENCFLGHPVSFNFVMPIELLSKCLYPSILHPFVMWLPWQSSWLSRKASSIKVHWLAALKAFSRLQHLLLPVLSWAWTAMRRDVQSGLCSSMLDWSWFSFSLFLLHSTWTNDLETLR